MEMGEDEQIEMEDQNNVRQKEGNLDDSVDDIISQNDDDNDQIDENSGEEDRESQSNLQPKKLFSTKKNGIVK